MKHRTNRGETGGLSFYRESNGAGVDLLIDQPARITLVEAKSGATPSSSYFDGANRVRRHLGRLPRPCEVAVVYGGDQFQQRAEGRLIPWRRLHAAGVPDSEFESSK